MIKYSFPQFKVDIVAPTVNVLKVIDNLEDKSCIVHIELTTETASYMHILTGFSYNETWSDVEINDWVNQELIKFEV